MDYFSQHIFLDPEKKTLDYSLWFLQNLDETMTAGYFLGGGGGRLLSDIPCLCPLYVYIRTATDPPTEPLSEQKEHKKIIEKGIPEDVHPGIKNKNVSQPLYINAILDLKHMPQHIYVRTCTKPKAYYYALIAMLYTNGMHGPQIAMYILLLYIIIYVGTASCRCHLWDAQQTWLQGPTALQTATGAALDWH